MRTTLTIDDELYRQTKALAALTGRTVGSVVEEALRVALARSQQATASVGPMPVAPGSPLAGIDLDDSAALLDAMANR